MHFINQLAVYGNPVLEFDNPTISKPRCQRAVRMIVPYHPNFERSGFNRVLCEHRARLEALLGRQVPNVGVCWALHDAHLVHKLTRQYGGVEGR